MCSLSFFLTNSLRLSVTFSLVHFDLVINQNEVDLSSMSVGVILWLTEKKEKESLICFSPKSARPCIKFRNLFLTSNKLLLNNFFVFV